MSAYETAHAAPFVAKAAGLGIKGCASRLFDLGGAPINLAQILYHSPLRLVGDNPKLVFITDPKSMAWLGLSYMALRLPNETNWPKPGATPWGPAEMFTFDDLPSPTGEYPYGVGFLVVDRNAPDLAVLLRNYVSP